MKIYMKSEPKATYKVHKDKKVEAGPYHGPSMKDILRQKIVYIVHMTIDVKLRLIHRMPAQRPG